MRTLTFVLLSAVALSAQGAAVRAKRPARKAAVAKPAPATQAEASRPAAAAPKSEGAALDELALFGLGVDLLAQESGLVVSFVRPGSRAEKAGLKAGDQLLRLDGAAASRSKAAAALRAWTPGTRLPLIVRRGLEVLSLETAPVPAPRDYARGDKDLSEHEKSLAADRSAQAASGGRAVVKAMAPLAVPVRADQGLWLRFPKGLPAGLKKGDELVAESATGLTVDASLDFLAVPPGSKVRGRVLDAVDDGQTRTVRLAFYALDLAGGGTYTTLGYATAVSGDQRMARVGPGGTLVAAAPLPDAKRRGPDPVLDVDARLRVRLLEPLVIDEPPSFWRAGPGIWVKTAETDGRRFYEITHSISGRSAESAGLKVGDRLDAIGGRSTEKMDFAEAIDRLYGKPGSDVEVSVVRGKSQTLKLKRGLRWTGGKSDPLPLAYNVQ